MRILIALADPALTRIYRNLFTQNGYPDSVSTTSAAEALDIIGKGGIGLVLTGYVSTSAPLVQMLRDIRALPAGKSIPCIVMGSAASVSKEFIDIKALGLAMPLATPVSADMLQQATNNVLRMAAG